MSTYYEFTKELFNQYYQQQFDSDTNSVGYPLIYVDKKKSTYAYPTKNGIISYTYKNLNNDKKTIKTITKYYYYKILDKWLYKDLLPLLGFVTVSGERPGLITNLDEYDGKKLFSESTQELEKKVKFMEKAIITKDIVKHVLKKVIEKYNINWADLEDYEDEIKKYFFRYLKNKLEEAISGVRH